MSKRIPPFEKRKLTTESWWIGKSPQGFSKIARSKTWVYGSGNAGFDPSLDATAALLARKRAWKAEHGEQGR